jgi:hypothetical protein
MTAYAQALYNLNTGEVVRFEFMSDFNATMINCGFPTKWVRIDTMRGKDFEEARNKLQEKWKKMLDMT